MHGSRLYEFVLVGLVQVKHAVDVDLPDWLEDTIESVIDPMGAKKPATVAVIFRHFTCTNSKEATYRYWRGMNAINIREAMVLREANT